jgi:hypothetical protein
MHSVNQRSKEYKNKSLLLATLIRSLTKCDLSVLSSKIYYEVFESCDQVMAILTSLRDFFRVEESQFGMRKSQSVGEVNSRNVRGFGWKRTAKGVQVGLKAKSVFLVGGKKMANFRGKLG